MDEKDLALLSPSFFSVFLASSKARRAAKALHVSLNEMDKSKIQEDTKANDAILQNIQTAQGHLEQTLNILKALTK